MANPHSEWYKQAKPGEWCNHDTRCPEAEPNGNCDRCDTIDGRFIGAVNEYASTCDGPCAELTMHESLAMDPVTQLGYCEECIPKLPLEIQARLDKKFLSQF